MTARLSPRSAQRFIAYSRLAGGLVICISLTAILGWILSIRILQSLVSISHSMMNPVTAIGLILSAVALVLLAPRPPLRANRHRLALGCAVIVILIGVSKLASYALPFSIDYLLFPGTTVGNPIAPNTAAAFVAVGLALLAMDYRTRRGHRPAVPLALLTTAIALLALTGYLHDVSTLYGVLGLYPDGD